MAQTQVSDFQSIRVEAKPDGFGAGITDLDISKPLPPETLQEVKDAWAAHGVI